MFVNFRNLCTDQFLSFKSCLYINHLKAYSNALLSLLLLQIYSVIYIYMYIYIHTYVCVTNSHHDHSLYLNLSAMTIRFAWSTLANSLCISCPAFPVPFPPTRSLSVHKLVQVYQIRLDGPCSHLEFSAHSRPSQSSCTLLTDLWLLFFLVLSGYVFLLLRLLCSRPSFFFCFFFLFFFFLAMCSLFASSSVGAGLR